MTTIIQTLNPERAIRIAGFSPQELERNGQPVVREGSVSIGFTLDHAGSIVDRSRQLTPDQARDAAHALLRAALEAEPGIPVTAEPGSLAGRLLGLSEDEEDYDDGKTLIAGVLYDNETGEEADPQ